jgi:hypothetical protein
MNYQKIYDQIIERAKTRQLEGYKERHHIIPKCLGGLNGKLNLVELTAREHFLCHRLLVEIYPDNKKLKYALYLMNIGKRKNKNANYNISSKTYEYLKKEHSNLMVGNKTRKGIPCSEETKRKIGEKNKHNKPEGFGNKPVGFGDKIKKSWVGRTITWRDKMIEGSKGVSRGKGIKKPDSGGKREIIQLDSNNQIIKEWNSITDACLFLNKPKGAGAITSCCKGKYKTAYGYKWKYK